MSEAKPLILDDGEFEYRIKMCADPDPDDRTCLGTQTNPTHDGPGHIRVRADQPRFRLLHTLMHEIGHCCEFKADKSIPDDVIDALARYYTNVLLKNPALTQMFLPPKKQAKR